MDPRIKALKNLTLDTYREVIELVLTGNISDLQAMIKNPKTTAIQVGVAKAFVEAINKGDYTVIERIAERIVGKIPDELNVRASNVNANLNAAVDIEQLKTMRAKLLGDV